MDLLGGKWKLLILFQLHEASRRPSELRRLIPDISEKMLLQELKDLCMNQLAQRIDYDEQPPRVEYRITEKGRLAIPVVEEMARFSNGYLSQS